jgi:hypothetical protein
LFHRSGPLPAGSNGDLVIDDEGIRWKPGWFARLVRRAALAVLWADVTGAEIIPVFLANGGPASAHMVIRTASEDFTFALSDLDGRRAGELLADYLETPG